MPNMLTLRIIGKYHLIKLKKNTEEYQKANPATRTIMEK